MVPVGEQTQHCRVIDRPDDTQPTMTQRDDRRRAGVMRVGLVGVPRVEKPHPGRQRRRHVNHRFTRGDELLRDQRAETRNNRSRCQRSALTRSSPTSRSVSSSTAAVCDPLCGSIPITNITRSSSRLTIVGCHGGQS
jgi:hypothetical protein